MYKCFAKVLRYAPVKTIDKTNRPQTSVLRTTGTSIKSVLTGAKSFTPLNPVIHNSKYFSFCDLFVKTLWLLIAYAK